MSEGNKKYLQKCKPNYLTEFPRLKRFLRMKNYVFYELSYCDFSIVHGVKKNIPQHFSSDKHLNAIAPLKNSIKISDIFTNN